MGDYAFANILLTGPCNLRCPDCIGHKLESGLHASTLGVFPLAGLDAFCNALVAHRIRQVSLTGIDTEPQLYRHQRQLLCHLRRRVPDVQVSLHTNGTRVLRDLALFNQYDRASISIPSFRADTYHAMTGSQHPPKLGRIVEFARIPIKVSVLVTHENRSEIQEILFRCRESGVRRVTLRRPFPSTGHWNPLPEAQPVRLFGGNPVVDLDGLEVTLWDFASTTLRCLNLFPDGSIGERYLLQERYHA